MKSLTWIFDPPQSVTPCLWTGDYPYLSRGRLMVRVRFALERRFIARDSQGGSLKQGRSEMTLNSFRLLTVKGALSTILDLLDNFRNAMATILPCERTWSAIDTTTRRDGEEPLDSWVPCESHLLWVSYLIGDIYIYIDFFIYLFLSRESRLNGGFGHLLCQENNTGPSDHRIEQTVEIKWSIYKLYLLLHDAHTSPTNKVYSSRPLHQTSSRLAYIACARLRHAPTGMLCLGYSHVAIISTMNSHGAWPEGHGRRY